MFELEKLVEPKTRLDKKEKTSNPCDLIIYNDDVNTFDFVIESIIKICEHSSIQAEQCTWIIHHNGKCSVKRGAIEKLKPMAEAFLDRGISAVIES
ncbi:MAG: Clp protease ClpS [Flavobacteriales bacterium]|nr:Clp protease ClpS [Flavobacteriales bacterium]MBO72673.1 Clp protease ClpS [Flavobacteriales bacterium]|tara:strand:+ start:257 stop:544 length:288 start_codon:yes stop_codon:yes gene_type:complete